MTWTRAQLQDLVARLRAEGLDDEQIDDTVLLAIDRELTVRSLEGRHGWRRWLPQRRRDDEETPPS